MRTRVWLLAGLIASGLSTGAAGQDWPHWRGPNYDGSTEAKGLPADFSPDKATWAAELPGPGAGTPIVLGDQVFVSSTDAENGQLVALCFDRISGELLWDDEAGSGYQPGGKGSKLSIHDRSNYASPSPVTDGERIVFFYGNGDLVCYSLEGERQWAKNLQETYGDFTFQWTFSASPTIHEGVLYLQILQRDKPVHGLGTENAPSFLLALDPETGDEIFRHVRPAPGKVESLESYATPIPFQSASGRKEILVVGGDVITGHDPKTGAELWRWGTWNPGHREIWWRLVPSTVIGDGVALVCAPKKAPVYAVKLGGSGELDESALAWKTEGRPNRVSSDVPTPLYYDGAFFVLSDVQRCLSRVNPKTGETVWSKDMPGKHWWRSSPTGADGKIYCMNHGGEVTVHDAKSGDQLAFVPMGESDDDQTRSTVVVAHNQLFIRTNSKLFCIGGATTSEQ